MKKFTLLFLVLFFVMGSAIAQNAEKKWAIGLGPGWYWGDNSTFGLNFYLSRYLSPSFDLLLKTDFNLIKNVNETTLEEKIVLEIFNPSLNLRWNLVKNGKVKPYLFAGPGFININLSKKTWAFITKLILAG